MLSVQCTWCARRSTTGVTCICPVTLGVDFGHGQHGSRCFELGFIGALVAGWGSTNLQRQPRTDVI
ncbi:hypothetical protein KCP69_03330 [Salmonella enterica subsp. enterica]|nr:hypothetical protein KCP69_03330 [Salmonella enterica subsp. enterica]